MNLITNSRASLAASANISAHETIPEQYDSTSALILSMTSNPRAEFLFGGMDFSPMKMSVSSKRTEPSHP